MPRSTKFHAFLFLALLTLIGAFPFSASAQEKGSSVSLPVIGSALFKSLDELPDRMMLAPELTALANTLNERSAAAPMEFSACLSLSDDRKTWSHGPILAGKEFTVFNEECGKGSMGFMHSHPVASKKFSNIDHAPSPLDYSVFVRNLRRLSVITHPSGICAFVHGSISSAKRIGRLLPLQIRLSRYHIAAHVQSDTEEAERRAVFESTARAANDFGAALFCGGTDGVLSKIRPVQAPTAETDVMMAKGLIIMLKATRYDSWPEIEFTFTPEIDDNFLIYLNRILNNADYEKLTRNSTPEEIVTTLLASDDFAADLGFGTTLTLPSAVLLDEGQSSLLFFCGPDSNTKALFCAIYTYSMGKGPGRKILFLAMHKKIDDHYINDFGKLDLNDYSSLNAERIGKGYLEQDNFIYHGEMRNHQPDGNGTIYFKEDKTRFTGTFSKGKIVKVTPVR